MTAFVAIDASSDNASVALRDGDRSIEFVLPGGRAQSERLLLEIDRLLGENGCAHSHIDAIAVAVGPGAFTGVRLAVATAQGLALAWDRPVIPVSSLAALAADAGETALPLLAALDARMGEIYAGWYRSDEASMLVPLADEAVLAPGDLTAPTGVDACIAIGSGVLAYKDAVIQAVGGHCRIINQAAPRAAMVAMLAARVWPAGAIAPERVEPAYLRNKVALTSAEQRALRRS